MSRGRFVLLGLARARSPWFRAVARWSTSAAVPAEFIKLVSHEELRAALDGGRPFSAVLLDGGLPGVDRDLLSRAREAGCAPLVVDDGQSNRSWAALGAAAVLSPDFTREELVDVLATTATVVGEPAATSVTGRPPDPLGAREARVIAVCGPGGTGASTAAIALSQQLSSDPAARPVLLADLALRAEQAVLHDAGDIVPGVQELVEACRSRHPSPEEVAALTFEVDGRGYRVLLGLRRPQHWATLRTAAFLAAFNALRAAFGTVVCDVTADFEGEAEGGSVDIEERNGMARTAVAHADAVVAVGVPGVKGLHALVRVLLDLLDAGVPAERLVPVVNVAPRGPRARAEITAALAGLLSLGSSQRSAVAAPVFLPRRRVDEALRDAAPVPAPLGALLVGALAGSRGPHPRRRVAAAREPQLVAPGSLGSWADDGQRP